MALEISLVVGSVTLSPLTTLSVCIFTVYDKNYRSLLQISTKPRKQVLVVDFWKEETHRKKRRHMDDVYEEMRALSVTIFERWQHQLFIDNEYARRLPGLRTYCADWSLEIRKQVLKGIEEAGLEVMLEKFQYFGYELREDRLVYRRHVHLPEWTNEPYPDIIMKNGELDMERVDGILVWYSVCDIVGSEIKLIVLNVFSLLYSFLPLVSRYISRKEVLGHHVLDAMICRLAFAKTFRPRATAKKLRPISVVQMVDLMLPPKSKRPSGGSKILYLQTKRQSS